MVRVRFGEAWRRNPQVREHLLELAEGQARGFSPRDLQDTLHLEIDDVDVTQGLLEGPLLESLAALFHSREHCTGIAGVSATLELRTVDETTSAVVTTSVAPSSTMCFEVDPKELRRAVRTAAAELHAALTSIHPGLGKIRGFDVLANCQFPPPRLSETKPQHAIQPDIFDDAAEAPLADPAQSAAHEIRWTTSLPRTGLRRVVLRRSWRAEAGGPEPRLTAMPDRVFAFTKTGVECLSADGETLWSAPVSNAQVVGGFVAGQSKRGRILVLDATNGRTRDFPATVLSGPLEEAILFHPPEGPTLVVRSQRDLIGLRVRSRWTRPFDVPIALTSSVDTLFVGTSDGAVQSLSGSGDIKWQRSSGFERVDTLLVNSAENLLLVAGADLAGRERIAAFDGIDGTQRWQREGGSSFATIENRLICGGDSRKGPFLSGIDVRSGAEVFRTNVPGEGRAITVAGDGRIYVSRRGGGLVVLSMEGRIRYETPVFDPDPSLSPVTPAPAIVSGGLVLTQGTHLHAVDAATGRWLGSIKPDELAPASAAILDGPTIVLATSEGGLEAWRVGGHLGVVDLL